MDGHSAHHMACEVHLTLKWFHQHSVSMQVDAAAVLETVNHLIACLLMDQPGTNLSHPGHDMHSMWCTSCQQCAAPCLHALRTAFAADMHLHSCMGFKLAHGSGNEIRQQLQLC